jgi:sterol desaturase/sphingolipid hydroxylase (fatty acid hydroxylase superfamily)
MVIEFDVRSFLLFLIIFSPLEYLLAERKEQKFIRNGWLTDALHFFISGIFIRAGLFAVIWGAMQLGSIGVPSVVRETLSGLPIWVQVIALTVIADLGFYVAHLLMHSIPFLWNFHAVHHSSEQMDWLASYRVHPVDQVLVKGTSYVPVFALGFSDAAIIIAALIYQWQALLIHSNVKLNFGPFKWLVASPEFHHWHHSNHAEACNTNFAGQLAFWDVIFRTSYLPGPLPEKYGVDDPVPRDYLMQLVYPFASGWRQLSARLRPSAAAVRDDATKPAG